MLACMRKHPLAFGNSVVWGHARPSINGIKQLAGAR
jgi:hypothetical protein